MGYRGGYRGGVQGWGIGDGRWGEVGLWGLIYWGSVHLADEIELRVTAGAIELPVAKRLAIGADKSAVVQQGRSTHSRRIEHPEPLSDDYIWMLRERRRVAQEGEPARHVAPVALGGAGCRGPLRQYRHVDISTTTAYAALTLPIHQYI